MRKASKEDLVRGWLIILSCALFMFIGASIAWSKAGNFKVLWMLLGMYLGVYAWGVMLIIGIRIFEFATADSSAGGSVPIGKLFYT